MPVAADFGRLRIFTPPGTGDPSWRGGSAVKCRPPPPHTHDMETTVEEASSPARFARERLLDPFHLIAVPALLVLLFAAHNGLTAPQSDWVIVGAYVLSHVSATAFAARFPPGSDRAKPIAFLVLVIGTSGALLYVLGWGAFLAVALVPPAAVVVQEDGSRYGRAAIAIVTSAILAGEAGVVIGVFPSLLPTKIGHLFAFVEAGGAPPRPPPPPPRPPGGG